MAKGAKGFRKLQGANIALIDASCVNEVILHDFGQNVRFHITSEIKDGIPVLRCERVPTPWTDLEKNTKKLTKRLDTQSTLVRDYD